MTSRVTAMTRHARSPLIGTGRPRLTSTVNPEHSKLVARSEHGPRTRSQTVGEDGTEQHGQTPLRSLDRRPNNQGVPILALHPARHRPTTAHRMTDEDDQALLHRREFTQCESASAPVALEGLAAELPAMSKVEGLPWMISFSYVRALQGLTIKTWAGKENNARDAQAAFHYRCRLTAAANAGRWSQNTERELEEIPSEAERELEATAT